jgi:hypothetical protein
VADGIDAATQLLRRGKEEDKRNFAENPLTFLIIAPVGLTAEGKIRKKGFLQTGPWPLGLFLESFKMALL